MKNGNILNILGICGILILFRCERALGINKVTGLQRWCPKLEVRKTRKRILLMKISKFITRNGMHGVKQPKVTKNVDKRISLSIIQKLLILL
jgi:hypothetical protein